MQIGATLMTDSHNRFLGNRALSPETLMMGYGYDPFLSERSLKPPIFQTSTFVFRSARDGKEFFELAYGLRPKRPNEEPGLISWGTGTLIVSDMDRRFDELPTPPGEREPSMTSLMTGMANMLPTPHGEREPAALRILALVKAVFQPLMGNGNRAH